MRNITMNNIGIVCHRGLWKKEHEQNTENAFKLALSNNYGIETDIRERNGEIVISHDIPINDNLISLDKFLLIYNDLGRNLPLLLNVKCDGIKEKTLSLLQKYSIENYFLFDMSIPETVHYANDNLVKFLSRVSDLEESPILLDKAKGLWVDSFYGDYPSFSFLENYIEQNYFLCFVSPELHGRQTNAFWNSLKEWIKSKDFKRNTVLICTDKADEAYLHFNYDHED